MTTQIPNQLKKRGINFVLLEKWGKKPFQTGWQNKSIEFDNPELLDHIQNGGNYGVKGGGDNMLLIIDFDNEELQNAIIPKLPKTFTVKTGTGKFHKYFFSDKAESFKIFDEEMNTLADIQGEGKQVVGPGSIHPNGNVYEVYDDSPISFLPYAEIKALLMPYDKKPKKEKKEFEKPKVNVQDDFLDKLKASLSIEDVLKSFGINTKTNPCACPFHDSKGGKCLGYNNETAHCFHCDGSWNIFSLVKDYKKCDFKEAIEYLADLAGLREELNISKKKYIETLNQIKAGSIFTPKIQAKVFGNIQPFFYDKNGNFWLWDSDYFKWKIVDDVEMLNIIERDTGEDVINPKNRTIIINSLKQEGRKQIPKPIKKTWIQFKDKIVDIDTGEELIATPEYFVTNPIPWELNSDQFVNTPTIDRIFSEWVGEKYVKTLYEIIAYCLIPDYPIHRLFCFIGEGLNGKSCFLRLLKKFVGDNNVTATELDTLISSRFEVTKLHKKLVCVMGETNFSEISKTSIIKKLTGQDTIGFEYKNKTPFDDVNYAKILIATNNLPTTTDKTTGFYRRWMIIDFPNKFSEQKDILADIPEEEYTCLARKCCFLLKDLLEKRSFTNEGSLEERTKRYEDHSDPLEKFLKEYTEEDFNESIWKFEFEKRLNDWCAENRFRRLSEVAIGKKMREKGIEQSQKMSEWLIDGQKKLVRVWLGIKWKGGNSQD